MTRGTGTPKDRDEVNIKRELQRIHIVVCYESRKRELKIRLMDEGRSDERLKARVEDSTCLTAFVTRLASQPLTLYLSLYLEF